jgi:uncharacterized protein (TIGR03118 family)
MKIESLNSLLLPAACLLLTTAASWAQKPSYDLGYSVSVLVASSTTYSPQILDPQLQDGWGIALRPPGAGGHIWVANAASGILSEFIGDLPGNPLHQDGLKHVPMIEPQWDDHGHAFVTGQVYNSASDLPGQPIEFPIYGPAMNLKGKTPERIKEGYYGSSKFVFVTEDGCINAWSSNTATAMDYALLMINYSKTSHNKPHELNSVFTGVAMTNNPASSEAFKKAGGNHIFAADIRNNEIDVFDNKWHNVTSSFHFQKPKDVGELSPFNIMDLNGHLFVAYGAYDPASDEGQEQIAGGGLGHIVEYTEEGKLVKDYDYGHCDLNLPWGMAIAPANFGRMSNDLIVANFGDGTISAFNMKSGNFDGYLRDRDTHIISIDGIWGLVFGNGVSLGQADALYYTSGPNTEQDGVFGRIDSHGDVRNNAAAPLAARGSSNN